MTLDELKAVAEWAQDAPSQLTLAPFTRALSPERVLAMLECIAATDEHFQYCDIQPDRYAEARKALEE